MKNIFIMQSEHECQCEICQFGEAFVEATEARHMQEYGWYAHMVLDDNDCPNNTNFHTHGLPHSFGHTDFQICIRVHPDIVMAILHDLVRRIKAGETFAPGTYPDIAKNYDTMIIEAKECGRPVLRLVVPNPENKFEGEMYEAQFTMLEHIPQN